MDSAYALAREERVASSCTTGIGLLRLNKTTRFLMMSSWILVSRAADAACTLRHTPDLSKEANPLSSVLGLGWTPLLAVVGLLSIYTVWALYRAMFRPMDLLPPEPGYTFSQSFAYTYLGRKAEWYATLYQLPRDLGRFHTYMGHVLSRCVAFAGVVSTVMWALILGSERYRSVHSAPVIYAILVVGSMAIVLWWNQRAYRRYLQRA